MSSNLHIRIISIVLLALAVQIFSSTAVAQQLRVDQTTPEFTDYVFKNDSLKIVAPDFLMVPWNNGEARYRILEQDVVRVSDPEEALLGVSGDINPLIPTSEHALAEVSEPFEYRKRWNTNLKLNVARRDVRRQGSYLITRHLRIRVYNEDYWSETYLTMSPQDAQPTDHPLASGTWYKIPVTQDGIYSLSRSYLEELGIPVGNIDPRDIQLWGAPGYELPKPNAESRPKWQQIPIIVEGESNGTFNSGDRVLFYGNSVNEVYFDESEFQWMHNKHSYARTNYVYLTVGSSRGERLTPAQVDGSPTRDINRFRDFIWKEEHRMKPESRHRSGTLWFGQMFTPEFSQGPILQDTIPGFVSDNTVEFHARMAARSRTTSTLSFTMNNQDAGSINILGVNQLGGDVGPLGRFGNVSRQLNGFNASNGIISINHQLTATSADTRAWVSYIHLRFDRTLTPKNGRLHFYSPLEPAQGNSVARYRFDGFSSRPLVMDVTNPVEPVLISVDGSGGNYSFNYFDNPGRRFVAQTSFRTPGQGEAVQNQNLHAINSFPNYIVITAEPLLDSAQELADYRAQKNGYRPIVVTQNQIFNEFSSGVPDPVAIRDFIRHLYLIAGTDDDLLPQHVVMFGDATYDYKNIENGSIQNLVFTFQHYIDQDNMNRSLTYGSDDFYVFMGENEGEWRMNQHHLLDLGIGRIPAQNNDEARIIIDKIKTFENRDNFGDWRSLFTFSADDAMNAGSNDRDLHTYNADYVAETIDPDGSGVRVRKIYQFSYPVINTPAGQRVPDATDDFINAINNGTQSIHFSGHGNEQQLTAQRLFQSSDISRLNNSDRPTILVTATCSFGRYDDNAERSGVQKMILHPNGGAAASLTTSRVVYTSSNPEADNNFGLHVQLVRQMVMRDANGMPQDMGTIFRRSKNQIIANLTAASVNNRKFILLGDPAMTVGLPEGRAQITEINGNTNLEEDPLQIRALDRVNIKGNVIDHNGQVNSAFNGTGVVRVYDSRRFESLPNPENFCNLLRNCGFFVQNEVLFNGRVSITNGEFETEFIVPKDISYSDSLGRIHVYALNPNSSDAAGSFSNFFLNGTNEDAENIYDGPELDIYLNDENFLNGSLVNPSPDLLVDIISEAGVNTTGSGVGHEIVAILRDENRPGQDRTFILNEFYTSELDDFTRGSIRYPLDNLEDGSYSLTVRAWDVFNNVGENQVFFEVSGGNDLRLRNVYNYPNPMHNFTRFAFEHNQAAGQPLDVFIRIYTLSGRPVAQIRESRIAAGNYELFEWNGRDDDNNRLAAGTYLYHIRVRSDGPNGRQTEEKIERLVILR